MLRKLSMFVLALLVPSLCPAENAVFNSIPFDKLWGPTRYQQVFDASLFPPGGAYIDQVSFIPDSPGEYGAAVEILLSHTTAIPGELSTVLDENITGPEEVVFSDSTFYQVLTIDPQDPNNPVVVNSDYGLVFDLDYPFFYDPGQGNLLMEIYISDQSRSLSALKVETIPSTVTSRVWESPYRPDTDSTSAGLYTYFRLTAIEPPPGEPVLTPVADPTPTDNTPVFPPPTHSGTFIFVGCSATGGNSDTGLIYLLVLLPWLRKMGAVRTL